MSWRLLFTAGFLLISAGGALSQSTVDPGLDLLRQRAREEQLERFRQSPQGVEVAPEQAVQGQSPVCFDIQSITVTGGSALPDGAISSITSAYEGRCLGQVEIEQLIRLIRQRYMRSGWITTQVTVPAQDLKSGTLRFDVVEGRIEAMEHAFVTPKGRLKPVPGRKTYGAFAGMQGEVFNLRDLEQGVAQINRTGASQAQVDIEPGQAPGTSKIVIKEAQQKQVRLNLALDNHGSRQTGHLRTRASVDVYDAVRLNEAFSLTYSGARSSNALASSVSVPYGFWTLSWSGSYSQQGQALTATADLVTESATTGVTLDKVVYRDAQHIVHVGYGQNWYWNRRFIGAVEPKLQFLAWGRPYVQWERFFEQWRLLLDVGASFGMPALGGTDDGAGLKASDAHARFTKFDASITWLKPLTSSLLFQFSSTVQMAPHALYSPVQLTLSSMDAVRGFRDASISGESGFYARSELQWTQSLPWYDPQAKTSSSDEGLMPKLQSLRDGVLTHGVPYVFVDGGRVFSQSTRQTTEIMSVGAGLRLQGTRVNADMSVAAPVYRTANRSSSPEVFFSLSVKLR